MAFRHVLAAMAVMVCASASPLVEAQSATQYETVFHFGLVVGGVSSDLSFPTADGYRITLPAAFDSWNCKVTSAYRSNDGKNVYHNLGCADTKSSLVIGLSVSCPLTSEGGDSSSLFMRANGSDITLAGYCLTKRKQTATKPNGGASL